MLKCETVADISVHIASWNRASVALGGSYWILIQDTL